MHVFFKKSKFLRQTSILGTIPQILFNVCTVSRLFIKITLFIYGPCMNEFYGVDGRANGMIDYQVFKAASFEVYFVAYIIPYFITVCCFLHQIPVA